MNTSFDNIVVHSRFGILKIDDHLQFIVGTHITSIPFISYEVQQRK